MANLADLLINLRADPSGIEEGMSKGKKLAIAGGAAIGGAIAAGAVKALDIGAANDKLAAQLGLMPEHSKRIGKVAGELYAGAYGGSIEEVNTAIGAVMTSMKGMRTASNSDIKSMTATALDFATAFDVDVQRSVDVAGRLLSTGLAKDGKEAFDLLTAASQRVPANLREDILDATDEYGQFFAGIGMNGQQAFATLVDASSKGMFGIDKIGDAVKEFTILSTDGSQSTKDAFKAIGLNAKTMQNSILAGGDSAAGATQKIIDGLLSIKDPGKQAQTALSLFGTPIEDLNVKDIPEFLKALQGGSHSMNGFADSAAEMGTTLNDNAATNLTSFKRQGEQAIVGFLGGVAIPTIEKAAEWFAYTLGPAISGIADTLSVTLVPALQKSVEFIQANQGPIKVIAGIIAAIFIPHLIKLATQYTITTARAIWAWTTQKAQAIAGAASTAVAAARVVASWVVMGAQAMARGAMMAAAWLLALGPIAIVIAAVAGVVVLVIKYWDQIKAAIATAAKALWGIIKGAFGLIKTVITTYVGMWVAVIRGAWNTIKAVVSGAVNGVLGVIKGVGKVVGIVRGFFADAVSAVSGKFGEIISLVTGLPGRIISGLGNIGQLLIGAGKDLIQGFINGIGQMAGLIVDALVGLLPWPLRKFAKKLGLASPSKLFKEHGKNVGLGFVIGLKSQAKTIGDTMDAITEKVAEQVQKARDYAQGIRDAFRQSADLTGFQYEEKKDSGADMLAQLAGQAKQAEAFTAAIAKLRKGGLNMTTLDQLIGAGPDALDDANRILSGGKAMIGDVNRLVGRINRAGNELGVTEARTRFLQPGRDIVGGARSIGEGGGKNALGDVYVEVEIDGEKLDARVKKVTREKDRATKRTVKSRARRAPARA